MTDEIIAVTLSKMEIPEMPTSGEEWEKYTQRRGRQLCSIVEDILNDAFPTLKTYTVFQDTQVLIILMGVPTSVNVIDLMTMYPADLFRLVFHSITRVKGMHFAREHRTGLNK